MAATPGYLFRSLLFVAGLLLGTQALAADSDGDGVDDAVDAFPSDMCGTADTDGDGMPDDITCTTQYFYENFDGTHIGPAFPTTSYGASKAWGGGYSGNGYSVLSSSSLPSQAAFSISLSKPAAFSFYYKCNNSGPYAVELKGVPSPLRLTSSQCAALPGWTQYSVVLPAGSRTIRFDAHVAEFLVDEIRIGSQTTLVLDNDDDNDGVGDSVDNCSLITNASQLNSDGDIFGDACDATPAFPDDDNDGVDNSADNCRVIVNSDQLNTDGDAQGNACDSDDDNDGVPDSVDLYPLDNSRAGDADNDGVDRIFDNCPTTSNPTQLNTDGDTQGDDCDVDDDNDGVADASDKFPLTPAASSDSDNDGFPGSWNSSCDATCHASSGLTLDNCPTTSNPTQANNDDDTQGDACDTDDDNDGVSDTYDSFPLDNTQAGDYDSDGIDGVGDNCPSTSNADQLNTDGDVQGNVCDSDDDNDGASDSSDKFPLNPAASSDSDNDGYPGSWRPSCDATCQANSGLTIDNCPTTANPTQLNTDGDAQGDACDSTPTGDTDGDSVDNAIDNCLTVSNADQLDANTNGIGDACEVTAENPLRNARAGSAVAFADFNSDGFDDVVVGIPLFDTPVLKDAGRIEIYSGATGDLLASFNGTTAGQQFGSALAVVADQNSDGIPDLVVGEPLFDVPATKPLNDAGRVVLYSGSDGALLQQIATGSAAGDRFGAAVAVGNGNLVVGSPWADLPLLKDAGYVTAFNGLTSDILYVRSGTQTKQFFGAALAFDEVNHHLLIGSPGFDVLAPAKLTDVGQVDIFDGSSGATAALFSVNGSATGNRFGSSIASFGADIGGNADVDWAVGSPGADVVDPVTLKPRKDIGNVQVFSGLNATVQVQIDGENAGDNFGAAISASGDINNDNAPDIAIGAPGYDASGVATLKDAGTVEVFSGSEVY